MHKRVAVDFDGTLFEDKGDIEFSYKNNIQLLPIEGASKGLIGYTIKVARDFDLYM